MSEDQDRQSSEIVKAEEQPQPGRLSKLARKAKAEMAKTQYRRHRKAVQ